MGEYLVTGGTSFIASHVVKALLDLGHSVRTTVRDSSVAHWSEIIEMLRPKYPLYPFETQCGSEEGRDMPHSLDTRKIHELGFGSFKSLAEMFDDCIKCFQDKVCTVIPIFLEFRIRH
ncbi:hypothetical protein YC2023_109699 [Brassica napus]